MAEEQYIGVAEFSKQMGCSERTTRRYIASGELEAFYIGGKYLISRASKARFIRGRLGARPAVPGVGSADAS